VFIGERAAEAPLFATPAGNRLKERSVRHVIKKMAKKAKVNSKLSPHWLRHAHASHSLDRGASVAEVASNLGHDSVATTSAYLHAKPGSSSGDRLDPEVWKDTGT
jgi:integrase/recombinase XerD